MAPRCSIIVDSNIRVTTSFVVVVLCITQFLLTGSFADSENAHFSGNYRDWGWTNWSAPVDGIRACIVSSGHVAQKSGMDVTVFFRNVCSNRFDSHVRVDWRVLDEQGHSASPREVREIE